MVLSRLVFLGPQEKKKRENGVVTGYFVWGPEKRRECVRGYSAVRVLHGVRDVCAGDRGGRLRIV
jgi:hypothetical protein